MSHSTTTISVDTGFSRSQTVLRSINNTAKQAVKSSPRIEHFIRHAQCNQCTIRLDTLLQERFKPQEMLVKRISEPEMIPLDKDGQPPVQFWKAGLEEHTPYAPPALGKPSVSTPAPPPEAGDVLVSLNYDYVTNAGTTLDVLA